MGNEPAAAPFRCALAFTLKDGKGTVQSEGNAKLTLEGETLSLLADGGSVIRFVDRDADSVREEDRIITVRLASGGALTLSKAGREHEALAARLTVFCDRGLIRDLLMDETEIFPSFQARASFKEQFGVRGSEFGVGRGDSKLEIRNPEPGSDFLCRLYLFESGLVCFQREGDPLRIPFGIVNIIKDEGLNLAVGLDNGGTWTFSALGRSRDPFRRALVSGLDALQTGMQAALKTAFPGLDPAAIPALSRLFKDGRVVFQDEADAAGPGLWGRLEKAWAASEAAEPYSFLKEKAAGSPIAFGVKHGLWGDRAGDYLFCLVPGPGGLIAWETTPLEPKEGSDETEGRATYFFKRETGGDWKVDVRALANRLLMINFRREPIYLASDKLEDAAHAQTARAVRHLESLKGLRKQFVGRIIHSTPDGWTSCVQKLMASEKKGG